MPKYRIISEPDTTAEVRAHRGMRMRDDEGRHISVHVAEGILQLLSNLASDGPHLTEHSKRRITSIEEIGPSLSFTDGQLNAAFAGPDGDFNDDEVLIEREDFESDTIPLYYRYDYHRIAERVVYALRASGLVPGLEISLLSNGDGCVYYTMIEVADEAIVGTYRSIGCVLKHLSDNREAIGWEGVLALAHGIIASADSLS